MSMSLYGLKDFSSSEDETLQVDVSVSICVIVSVSVSAILVHLECLSVFLHLRIYHYL